MVVAVAPNGPQALLGKRCASRHNKTPSVTKRPPNFEDLTMPTMSTAEKKQLIRDLIDLAHSEGSEIEFDHQFGHDGFVDSNGEFWATDGYSVSEICNRITTACTSEFL